MADWRAAALAWPRRWPEMEEEVVRGRDEMPGPIWEWCSARDFDPLPDLSFFFTLALLLSTFFQSRALPSLLLAPGFFFPSCSGPFLHFFPALLSSQWPIRLNLEDYSAFAHFSAK